ncbi:hypothetical protein BI375_09975 [Vibrio rotiferianus]|jgi:hypothetical protein|uniref:SPOR domain-containing protein n=1 Tax=Vibrio rotiferianus TaxID=190895 RepID=A0ABX3D3Q1_9VIBR|nr:hypothetical protein [Vibrio rotiferianus]OHY89149.1 hypothetical protein BI375_09975 [Vibrio rotiferianus]
MQKLYDVGFCKIALVRLFSTVVVFSVFSLVSFFSWAEVPKALERAINEWNKSEPHQTIAPHCTLAVKQTGSSLNVVTREKCRIDQLAVYILANECELKREVKRVSILNGTNEPLLFPINEDSCSLLTQDSDKPKVNESNISTQRKIKTSIANESAMVTVNIVQFYAGKTKPNIEEFNCAGIPLDVHHIQGVYYVFSEVFLSLNEAKNIVQLSKKRCPRMKPWVKPIPIKKKVKS